MKNWFSWSGSTIECFTLTAVFVFCFTCFVKMLQVYEASWYMLHYGSSSPKRHVMFSNSSHITKLWRGKLLGWKKNNNSDTKPCKTYLDGSGRKRFCGTKFLKSTEKLGVSYVLLRNLVPPNHGWYMDCFFGRFPPNPIEEKFLKNSMSESGRKDSQRKHHLEHNYFLRLMLWKYKGQCPVS